jgi:2,4-diketo-3-deoxy-L-fuconate hydrolase
LQPGDLVITGTPPGVGEGKKPNAIYLNVGDVMHLGVSTLGEQQQKVVAFSLANQEIFE